MPVVPDDSDSNSGCSRRRTNPPRPSCSATPARHASSTAIVSIPGNGFSPAGTSTKRAPKCAAMRRFSSAGPAHIHRQDDCAEPRDGQQCDDVVSVVAERHADDVARRDAACFQVTGGPRDQAGELRVGDRQLPLDDRGMARTTARVVEDRVRNVQPALGLGTAISSCMVGRRKVSKLAPLSLPARPACSRRASTPSGSPP